MTTQPIKSIQTLITSSTGINSIQWINPIGLPVQSGITPPGPVLKDYKWRIQASVTTQLHSSSTTRQPGLYNGQDINVGDWIANTLTGQAWKIISVESKTNSSVVLIIQDIGKYNIFRDSAQVGNGLPQTGYYVVFNLGDNGLPLIDPSPPNGVSAGFFINLESRFQKFNDQYDFELYQTNHNFISGDIVAVDSSSHTFVKSNDNIKPVIGKVNSVIDTNTFTINPSQKIVNYFDTMPGNIGDVIYSDLSNPGKLTITPSGSQIYIKLRNSTYTDVRSLLSGPGTVGNSILLNGQYVTLGGSGTLANLVTAINNVNSSTGVTASSVLSYSSTQTIYQNLSTLYGEPLLWAATSPATALINSTIVTFNITSTETGYTNYVRAAQMAACINRENIANIVASTTGTNLIITNIAGGAINISNIGNDVNGIPFGGSNSGSGVLLSTSASTTSVLYCRNDNSSAAPINFTNVSGSIIDNFGLMSSENGIKAIGLFVNKGLRQPTTLFVSNLSQLQVTESVFGDMAFVADSIDSSGNNSGKWSMWLSTVTGWINVNNENTSTTVGHSLRQLVGFASNSTISLGVISTGRRATLITVNVITPFNSNPLIDIGYTINNLTSPVTSINGLMDSGLIDLNVAGTYTVSTDILFGQDTVDGDVNITARYTRNSATIGSAEIIVSYI